MKVGVLQFFSWPERRVALETVYERAFQRIEVMDRSGYDAVWLAEHHFTGYSVCPSVHLMGMHVANRTRKLRIGTAVSLAAFYHPLRLAKAGVALVRRNAEVRELVAVEAPAGAPVDAAPGEHVEERHLLGEA